jgi:hypothetical protein
VSSEIAATEKPAPAANKRWQARIALVLVAAVFVPVGATLVYQFPPSEYSFYPRCVFNALTGLHCPGCGATRCVGALLQGDIAQAFAYNPLFVLLLPFLAYAFGRGAYRSWTGKKAPGQAIPPIALKVLAFVLAAYFIARNIPVYPFDLLAPHQL